MKTTTTSSSGSNRIQSFLEDEVQTMTPVQVQVDRPVAAELPASIGEAPPDWSDELLQPAGNKSVASVNRWKRRWSLIASDVFAMTVATIIALVLSDTTRAALLIPANRYGIPESQLVMVVMMVLPILVLVWSSYLMGHYTRLKPLWNEAKDFVRIIGYTIAVIAVVLYFSNTHFSRIWFVAYWPLIFVLVPLCRYLAKMVLISTGNFYVPVVIFGTGVNAQRSASTIESDRMLGLKVVSFLHTGSTNEAVPGGDAWSKLAHFRDYNRAILDEKYDHPHYLFALDSAEDFEFNRHLINSFIGSCRFITVSPPLFGLPLDGAEVLNVQPCDSVLIRLQNNSSKKHNILMKRSMDIAGSMLAIILISPLFLVLFFMIKADGGPVFYKQVRIGRYGKKFNCWKIRSMVTNADQVLEKYLANHPELKEAWERDHKLKNDPRITSVGQFIRKGSIDELPQLWNVLKGEMSLVGPRPIVAEESSRYGEMLNYYLGSRPGITGLWQISGRNDTTYDERVDLDVWYSRNWSLWLDIVILLRTVPTVMFRSGAY